MIVIVIVFKRIQTRKFQSLYPKINIRVCVRVFVQACINSSGADRLFLDHFSVWKTNIEVAAMQLYALVRVPKLNESAYILHMVG